MKTFLSIFLFLGLSLSVHGDVTMQWIHLLKGRFSSMEEKALACQRLGEFGDVRAVPNLAALLMDPGLNTYARAALERIPGRESRIALRKALATCEGTQLAGVIESLGNLGADEAAGDLTKLIGKDDKAVSDAALRALGRMGRKTLPVVLGYLKDTSPEIRASAATASLLAAEMLADPKIYDAILISGVPRQSHLAAVRGAILTKVTLTFLFEQLRSGEKDVQDVAFLALRSFPAQGLAEAMHKELIRKGGADPVRLVYALRDRPNDNTQGVLIEHLASAEGALQSAIIQALGHLGGRQSADALLSLVHLDEAVVALTQMQGKGIDERIVARLKEEKELTRRQSLIGLLGDRRAEVAIDLLLVQAKDGNPDIRAAAFRALRPMVGLPQVSELIALFKATDKKTSTLAWNALESACRRSQPLEAAGKQILSELNSTSTRENQEPWIRILILTGYGPALPIIVKDLKSTDAETVEATIRLLARWPDPAPVDALFLVSKDSRYQATALYSILSLIGTSQDKSARFSWLQQARPLVSSVAEKRQFIALVGETFDPGSLDLLKPYLQDDEVGEEARDASRSLARNMRL